MNDNDLERDLRAQHSPREQGYAPTRLPMTLEEAPVARRGPSRLPQVAMLVGAGMAGALAVAIAAGAFSGGPVPGVGATGSPSPSAVASTSTGGGCGSADVALTAEPWGGAMGSRGTVVTVTLAEGRPSCTIPTQASAQITDANGNVLVSGQTPSAAGSVTLEPGASFDIGVAWSNWCGSQPAAPMTFLLGLGDQPPSAVGAQGSVPATAVPPCNGAGPSALSLTDLQPQP
jgi:hypothetical protein